MGSSLGGAVDGTEEASTACEYLDVAVIVVVPDLVLVPVGDDVDDEVDDDLIGLLRSIHEVLARGDGHDSVSDLDDEHAANRNADADSWLGCCSCRH